MKAEITACGEDALYNEIEFPLAQVLADMTRTGVLVDKGRHRAVRRKAAGGTGTGADPHPHGDRQRRISTPTVPSSWARCFSTPWACPHGKKTQRGWSTDAETLEALRDYPLVEDILQYRAYQKLNSTYVEGLLKVIGEDGRIHSTFNQTEARTGRLSSDNPNLQNIPIRTELGSQLRAYFVAKAGLCAGGRRLQPDRAAHSGAHHRGRAHAAGIFERRGYPPQHRRQDLRHSAGAR